jgi:hypothetical protein
VDKRNGYSGNEKYKRGNTQDKRNPKEWINETYSRYLYFVYPRVEEAARLDGVAYEHRGRVPHMTAAATSAYAVDGEQRCPRRGKAPL